MEQINIYWAHFNTSGNTIWDLRQCLSKGIAKISKAYTSISQELVTMAKTNSCEHHQTKRKLLQFQCPTAYKHYSKLQEPSGIKGTQVKLDALEEELQNIPYVTQFSELNSGKGILGIGSLSCFTSTIAINKNLPSLLT